jgi:hypothetical protein
MDFPSSEQAQQEVWRKRLADAETAFRDASLALENALQIEGEASSSAVATRDRKNGARVEYLRVLRVFSDIVLRGKLPRPGTR